MKGIVYLVGAGPGDPELITLKGCAVIQQADVIIYDRLVHPQLLHHAKQGATCIYVGKRPDHHTYSQKEINELLVTHAKEGKTVVRLKGGDPFVFGRGGEEAECCVKEGIPYEVIPGITSAIAVPAYAGIPVTHRQINSSFAVITGHEHPDKAISSICWEKISTATETLVFLMGVNNLPFIVEQLIRHGRPKDTPIALIRYGTYANQGTLLSRLDQVMQEPKIMQFTSPAVIVVGDVVKCREELLWFENKPLFGKRILVTRARSQNSDLLKQLKALGAEAIEFPVIRIVPPQNPKPLDDALKRISRYDWIVFTSVNGVEHTLNRLQELQIDIRTMKAKIGAIGPKTAQVLQLRGLMVEVLPTEYQAEELGNALKEKIKQGEEVLLPRANIARNELVEELTKMGCLVTAVDAYDTERVDEGAFQVVELLKENAIDFITFTSSSTVKNFVRAISQVQEDYLSFLHHSQIMCIGPVTANTAREYGLCVDGVAKVYTIDGLVETILTNSSISHTLRESGTHGFSRGLEKALT